MNWPGIIITPILVILIIWLCNLLIDKLDSNLKKKQAQLDELVKRHNVLQDAVKEDSEYRTSYLPTLSKILEDNNIT